MQDKLPLYLLGVGAIAATFPKLKRRLELSRAKHRSLAGHSKLARRIARLIPFYEYGDSRFFSSDGAPEAVIAQRRAALDQLATTFNQRYEKSNALTEKLSEGLSDLQFTSAYRVPFQYSRYLTSRIPQASIVTKSSGVLLHDLDGNAAYDLTGSYGVNLLGYDFYKDCIDAAVEQVRSLGPVLGSYHPVVLDNVERLRSISGLDEVSFHMSGTEAVMQAVRLSRFHTERSHLVRFCGAYHGWWDDVQPGIGTPTAPKATYTLKEMDDDTLRVLRTRTDIACVLVNPLQALHPNSGAPGDSSLVDSSRKAGFNREAYAAWLKNLRQVCTERAIVLIFDEVFVGFRLAPGGAQQYFGVRADMVTYGKTLGGGLPVGVLCGRSNLMQRTRTGRPVDICFARGTFNSHPYVMGAMNAFLKRFDTPQIQGLFDGLDDLWDSRADKLNRHLQEKDLPVRVANLSTIWTVLFTEPSRYNWMFQYYLKCHGLALSWVGSGRLIFSLNYSAQDFDAVQAAFIAAAEGMRSDGWWWHDPTLTNQSIKRMVLREMLAIRLG